MKYAKRMNQWLVSVLLACSLVLSTAWAADEEDARNSTGTIDYIDLSQRSIVIDDMVYHLSLSLKVHEGNTLSTDYALREKVTVSFEIDPDTERHAVQTITDVWLNP